MNRKGILYNKTYSSAKSVLLVLLSSFAFQLSFGQTTYADNFDVISYSNQDGTANWSGDWVEVDPVGVPGPDDGIISIVGGELSMTFIFNGENISRSADLSGAPSALLSFDWRTVSIDAGFGEAITVQMSSDGVSFDSIFVFDGSNSGSVVDFDISTYISANTTIRFINVNNNWEDDDFAFFDNVIITEGEPDEPPVITATGNQSMCPTLETQNIATAVSITDPDSATIDDVSIQISSGYVNGEDTLELENPATHPNITGSFDVVEGELTLEGPATLAEFEAAILDVIYASSNATATGSRSFSITIGLPNFLPATGHYYEYVPSLGITWTAAQTAASARTFFGLQGYLATLTTQEEADFSGTQAAGLGWIGASDVVTEGDWRWVTGPEGLENAGLGRQFWLGLAGGTTTAPDFFAFWNAAEPNQSGNEDYAHITDVSVTTTPGSWNDLSNTGAGSGPFQPQGYVVEYGGLPGDPTLNVTATTTIILDGCADTDGDTVEDRFDLDDDNDGILDADECPVFSASILWVTDGATASALEQGVIDALIALGHTVTVVDDAVGGDANSFDATFVFEDAVSGTALTNVANIVTTTNGVVLSEPFLFDDVIFANAGTQDNTNLVNIVNNTHPITSGLPLGNYDIGDASQRASDPLASGTLLGEHPNGEGSLAVWETGDVLEDLTTTAPGRRVIVPHGNPNGGFNAAGQDLLVQAIVWAANATTSPVDIDTDGDLVSDCLDLDSDNDGIYDAVEAGHGQAHTNGILNGPVGDDGVPDVVQAAGQEDSGTVDYTIADSDADSDFDFRELDSDDDGCNDVIEAGYTDDNDDGLLGDAPLTVDPDNGVVTSGTDGYTTPRDGDANSTFDFQEAISAGISINTQPAASTICPGANTTFTVAASGSNLEYQWQVDSGSGFNDKWRSLFWSYFG